MSVKIQVQVQSESDALERHAGGHGRCGGEFSHAPRHGQAFGLFLDAREVGLDAAVGKNTGLAIGDVPNRRPRFGLGCSVHADAVEKAARGAIEEVAIVSLHVSQRAARENPSRSDSPGTPCGANRPTQASGTMHLAWMGADRQYIRA